LERWVNLINRVIDLRSDTNLQAIYVQQYELTVDSSFPSSGDGWYDQGTTVSYSTDARPRVTDSFGVMIFVGWHDENGGMVDSGGSGSIVMDGPNALEARWLTLNYLIPSIVLVLFGFVYVFKVTLRGR